MEIEPSASVGRDMRVIHLSTAFLIPVRNLPVVLMLTAQPLVNVLCASVEVVTLATHSQSVVWNLALPALVAQMLTAHLLEGQLYANASQATQVTRTQTAALTHAP